MKTSPEQSRYAAMGVAALLPGMQYAIETMQAKLDEMRALLAHTQQNGATRPIKKVTGGQFGWAGMTPEERSVEMKRRMALSRNAEKQSDLSAQRKREWAALSKAKRKARLDKMAAGRRAKEAARAAA